MSIQVGDVIVVSGDIGAYGAEQLMLGEEPKLEGVCEMLEPVVEALKEGNISISALCDTPNSGLTSVLNEWVQSSNLCLELEESTFVIDYEVENTCKIFEVEAIDLANKDRLILAVAPMHATFALEIFKKFDCCRRAAVVGRVTRNELRKVILYSSSGSSQVLNNT